jgi:hypothetical protein
VGETVLTCIAVLYAVLCGILVRRLRKPQKSTGWFQELNLSSALWDAYVLFLSASV